MDRLVEATLEHGLIPPVVMEFPGITVGGGYAGTSGESSSFKHGFFDRTINSVEMVLADGQIVTCSNDQNEDLFHGAAGAVGSLGIITLAELQLREATSYVEVRYQAASSVSEAVRSIKDAASNTAIDYVDGMVYSQEHAAIITARLTDIPAYPVQCFSNAEDPWFYMHVEEKTKAAKSTIESIPLAEYLFRYDRGGFWVGKSAFEYFKMVPFNKYTRWLLDVFLHTRMMYTALHASGQSKKFIVQDLALPYERAVEFIDYTDSKFGIYPLWLCPLRQNPLPTMHPHLNDKEADGKHLEPMLNIGLWGWGPSSPDEFVKANKGLETKLQELGGMKWLYAHTYYTEAEFWSMFDRDWYDALRKKYTATSLPSVYEKVRTNDVVKQKPTAADYLISIWPISGLYGILKAIGSGSYLEARASTWKYTAKKDDLLPLSKGV